MCCINIHIAVLWAITTNNAGNCLVSEMSWPKRLFLSIEWKRLLMLNNFMQLVVHINKRWGKRSRWQHLRHTFDFTTNPPIAMPYLWVVVKRVAIIANRIWLNRRRLSVWLMNFRRRRFRLWCFDTRESSRSSDISYVNRRYASISCGVWIQWKRK